MPVKVEVKMDGDSMADFMIYHIYTSRAGMLALALGMLNVGLTVAFAMRGQYGLMGMFFAFAVLILGVIPLVVRKKVKTQVQNSTRLSQPVTYEFSEEGVETVTEQDSGKAGWKVFKKAVSRKRILILYAASKQAIVLPIEQLGTDYTAIVDLIFAHMPAPAVQIRRVDGKK